MAPIPDSAFVPKATNRRFAIPWTAYPLDADSKEQWRIPPGPDNRAVRRNPARIGSLLLRRRGRADHALTRVVGRHDAVSVDHAVLANQVAMAGVGESDTPHLRGEIHLA